MRDEILRLFGERLRELRTERNLSQEHLAELAGLDRNYIGQIERAERNVALVNIVKIAKAMKIEPGELFVPLRRMLSRGCGNGHTASNFPAVNAFSRLAFEASDQQRFGRAQESFFRTTLVLTSQPSLQSLPVMMATGHFRLLLMGLRLRRRVLGKLVKMTSMSVSPGFDPGMDIRCSWRGAHFGLASACSAPQNM